ncbi:MAG TPA: S1C family serine protease [Candidatus Dormibacteraeota bacterium]|nr:S1C family serine protease [Candidatus Dormibacteraeota bacterium]
MSGAAARRPPLLAAVVLSACVGLLGGASAAWALYERLGPAREIVSTPAQSGTAGSAGTFGDVAAKAAPSIVKIVTQPQSPTDLVQGPRGFAVGFVASADGLVVTSAHALTGATQLRLAFNDGHIVDASVADSDPGHGLVVLRPADSRGLTPLTFADFEAHPTRPGDLAIVVGSPPLATVSVSTGTVRSVGRNVVMSTGPTVVVDDVLTVDATADPADDGAPLLDGAGQVIGVVVASPSAGPPGLLTLSGRAAAGMVNRLSHGGTSRSSGFGVDAVPIDAATAAAAGTRPGALIRSVLPGGPADAAGLVAGDVVIRVQGTAVDADHPLDPVVLGLASGQRVTLSVVRGNSDFNVDLTLG